MIIYKTTNLINGLIYIGKACGKSVSNGYLGSGAKLKQDITKYGKDAFNRVTIDAAESRADQCKKEIFWIAFYRVNLGRGSLYNIADGGQDGGNFWGEKENHPMYGKHHSEEAKFKIGSASKKRNSGESNPMFQHEYSIETKVKMSTHAKERFKNKENHPFFGKTGSKSPHYGKHCSEETKQKMSNARKEFLRSKLKEK